MSSDRICALHRVLGAAFLDLPVAVQAAHEHDGALTLSGRADVVLRRGVVSWLIAWAFGLPRHGPDQPVTIVFETDGRGFDHWRRDFAGRRYRSVLRADSGLLIERQGSFLDVRYRLAARPDRLILDLIGFGVFGVPLPRWLSPRCDAFESSSGDAFTFDITIDLPFLGRFIHYCGHLNDWH